MFFILKLEASEETSDLWEYDIIDSFKSNINLFRDYKPTSGFQARKYYYLQVSRESEEFYAQSSRIYMGDPINEETLTTNLKKIINFEDCMDFQMNAYLRMLYLNLNTNILGEEIKNTIIDALGKGKYWYTEPNVDTAIYYTENHQILYHSAELLVGQLFPNDFFTNSNMTGTEHVDHAIPLIERWINWRGQLGFTEWNSGHYLMEDMAALLNIIDFCNYPDLVNKAAMLLDLIAFGFANNFFKNRYATSMGRAYDRNKIERSYDNTAEAAWIMLGLGECNEISNMAAVALATSDNYAPPPILEEIAEDASKSYEHWERSSIYLEEGPKYDTAYEGEDLMYWWSMSAQLSPPIIENAIELSKKYNIDPMTDSVPLTLIKTLSFLRGKSISDYAKSAELLARGACLETANLYTYRTPYYQLSGVQDHKKGMNGMQEHIWQASLDDNAYVFTNSPGGITQHFDQQFMGGWKPKSTFYKNIGVIQYDRETMPLEFEALLSLYTSFSANKRINHAYFPRSAFDQWESKNGWTFGAKDGGYVALYSFEPAIWASDYELLVEGYKNTWIVELGSNKEYGTFENFTSMILKSEILIKPESLGYDVYYDSPSQGIVTVSWNNPFIVAGVEIDLGDYPRYNNDYCYQEFGTKKTIIQHNNQKLELDFENASRLYSIA